MLEKTECANCGKTFYLAAERCPHCGTINPSPAAQAAKGSNSTWPLIALVLFLTLSCLAVFFATRSTARTTSPTASRRAGWLCDFDETGQIRLWSAASVQATVSDVVGTCIACCVDVSVRDEKTSDGIIFYNVSVGGQSGWVDVDYFYSNKPSWSSN